MSQREVYPSDHPTPGIFVSQLLEHHPVAFEQGMEAAQNIEGTLAQQQISNPELVGEYIQYTALTNPDDLDYTERRNVVWRGIFVAYQTLRQIPKDTPTYLMEAQGDIRLDEYRMVNLTLQGVDMASTNLLYMAACDYYQPFVDPEDAYPAGLLRGVLGGFAMLENGERFSRQLTEEVQRQAEVRRLREWWAA